MTTEKIQCEFISWNQFLALSKKLVLKIKDSGFKPDMIVAIGRGGYTPARILSDYMDINNLTSFKIEHYHSAMKSPEVIVKYPLAAEIDDLNILLVDDVSDTGDTYTVALNHLAEKGNAKQIKTVALHHKVVSSYKPDFYVQEIKEWRWIIYPWAVYEDVSGFIKAMSPRPKTVDAIQKCLLNDHNLTVPIQLLSDIVQIMDC